MNLLKKKKYLDKNVVMIIPLPADQYPYIRRWVILSSQEPTEVQISKLELRLCRKNQKCILVIALNPKILHAFSNCSV